MPALEAYRDKWTSWIKGQRPLAASGHIRICAWHIDFDEQPVCYLDVSTEAEARLICADLSAACSANVDFAAAYDDTGREIVARSY